MRKPVAWAVGDRLASRTLGPITQTDIVRFAGAGGDFNPLHHDPEFAARAGFSRVIAMGQLQAGLLAGWVSDAVHVEHLRSLEVRFVGPLFVGDTLLLQGSVTAIDDTEDAAVATLDVSGTKDGGEVVVKAIATATVAPVQPGFR